MHYLWKVPKMRGSDERGVAYVRNGGDDDKLVPLHDADMFKLSVRTDVLCFLRETNRPQRLIEIVQRLTQANWDHAPANIRKAVQRLTKEGCLYPVDRGIYKLTSRGRDEIKLVPRGNWNTTPFEESSVDFDS